MPLKNVRYPSSKLKTSLPFYHWMDVNHIGPLQYHRSSLQQHLQKGQKQGKCYFSCKSNPIVSWELLPRVGTHETYRSHLQFWKFPRVLNFATLANMLPIWKQCKTAWSFNMKLPPLIFQYLFPDNLFTCLDTQDTSLWLDLSPLDTVTPDGPLTLWNCFINFAVEHWFGCHATEPGFARDIGAIEIWLVDWYWERANQTSTAQL